MPSQGQFGDVTFRTANSGALGVKTSARLIFDSKKLLMLPKWGVNEDLPKNSGQTIQFRRYHNVDTGLNPIFGNTNPSAVKMSWSDFTTTLYRYGGVIDIPEHMMDTHEDNLVQLATDQMSYDLARKIETLTYNVVKGGSNAIYANGAANRSSITNVMTEADLEAAIATLEENNAVEIQDLVTSSPSYETLPIQPSYIAYCHTNVAPVVRRMASFISVEHYAGNTAVLPGEIGNVMGKIRVVCSNIAMPFDGVGGNPVTNSIRGIGGSAHVYPFLIFAKNAFAVSKLSGENSMKVMIKKPSENGDSYDKLGLNGHIGYKTWFAATILNNDNLVRIETGVPALISGDENASGPAF
jgi:N4-gp56 family major capsid protein